MVEKRGKSWFENFIKVVNNFILVLKHVYIGFHANQPKIVDLYKKQHIDFLYIKIILFFNSLIMVNICKIISL